MNSASERITLKSPREIELMRTAGQVVARVLSELGRMIEPGVTTLDLDRRAESLIREAGATALFKGEKNPYARFPFPACICASVNEAVVHGIPDERPLESGDIISIDCGVRLNGYCGDAARTFAVGEIPAEAGRLLDVTRRALELATEEMRPGVRWSKIGRKLEELVEGQHFSVVRDFVGHGIGRKMHEEPKVPNYWPSGRQEGDFELAPGMTLAVEPMVTAGRPEVEPGDRAGWTMVTRDRSLAAHFENTIAVSADGVEVLTDFSD